MPARVALAVLLLVVPLPARAQTLDPLLVQGQVLMNEIYDVARWTVRVPYRLAMPLVARARLEAYVDALPLAPDVRARVRARIASRGLVDEVIPFLLALRETYVATPAARADDFDAWLRAHFGPGDGVPGIEHSMFHWAPAEARTPPALAVDAEIAGHLVTLYDALYLQDDPAAALGEQLACDRPRTEAEVRVLVARMAPTVRRLLAHAAARLGNEGEAADGVRHVLEDDDRLEAVTVSFVDFTGAEVCKHYRVFATRVLREAALRDWMRHELDEPGGGRLWSFLEYAEHGRRYGALVVVDGLQGHLVEALARGAPAQTFVQAIAREQRAGAALPAPPSVTAPPQATRFLMRLATEGFHHPFYLPFFRRLYGTGAAGVAHGGIATTPTISVRNIPLATTGAPVAGPGGTGIPNFHFVDRTYTRDGERVGRPYYFYGNDAVQLDALMRAAGLRTLIDRLPRLSSLSCTAQLDGGAQWTIDPFLNLGIGERVRDFGEVLCLPELERRAANEVRLRALRARLSAMRDQLPPPRHWYEWYERLGQRGTRVLARRLIDEIAGLEQEAMPELLIYYNPWPDHFAHFTGPFADEILAPSGELNRLDYWLGRLTATYDAAGVAGRTLFGMAGDHGLTPVFRLLNPEVVVFDALRRQGVDFRVLKISSDEGEGPKLTNRLHPPSMKGIDVVVASTAGGNYMLDLFKDQGAGWAEQPLAGDLTHVRPLAHPEARAVDLVRELQARLGASLDYLAVREGPCNTDGGTVRLVGTRDGRRVDAWITRADDRIKYTFDRVDLLDLGRPSPYDDESAAGRAAHLALVRACVVTIDRRDPSTWCTEGEWRALASHTARPDAVVQLAHLYDIDRAGTVNLFPRRGIGYNSKVPGRHAGETFHEKDAFVGLWGAPVSRTATRGRLPAAVNGSVPIAIYEYLSGTRVTPGTDGWGYPSLAGELFDE